MLELEVQDLGKLLMHVKTNHNEVATHILTDNQQVQELLQRGVPLLRQELESQGLTLGQLLIDLRQGKQERYPLLERGYRISRSAASGALEATEAAASRPPAVVTSRHGSGHWVNLVA
jgi:flagellar hook-length control protein FliK